MARRENGEFEILLGNKQLLSIFFIVVILLGVFFTMGYVLGRNSAADEAAGTAAMTVAPRPAGESRPAKESSAFSGSGVAQPQASEPPASTAETELAAVIEPSPGQTFLQVVAVQRTDAEVIAGVLKRKGFPSLIAPSPSPPLFRVLVGPLPDADALTRTRRELEDAGFKPIVRKY